ncbi:MAG: SRPBCC family protein [Bacteroidota bacterium]|nr:MAG: SRPBCC family protein [Bacteroidota bacterium]
MKALKIIGIVLLVLLAIVLIPPAFVDGNYAVEREVTIEQPVEVAFDYFKLLKNQEDYSVWSKMDPAMEKSYSGTDGTVGAVYYWSGNKDVGKGEQEIIAVKDGERIDYVLRFMEPFESTDFAYITTESKSDSVCVVKWGFTGKMTYPMKGMLLFMDMENMLGQQLGEGLENAKKVLESI